MPKVKRYKYKNIAAALAIIAPIVPDALPHRKKIQIKKHKIL